MEAYFRITGPGCRLDTSGAKHGQYRTMKSAYELAMERLGGEQKLSAALKKQLAEIDAKYAARKAEAELRAQASLRKADGDPEKVRTVSAELDADLRRIEDRREREKEKVRAS